jgi:cystathionine beta-lyase/cystathionine gamma-synthase
VKKLRPATVGVRHATLPPSRTEPEAPAITPAAVYRFDSIEELQEVSSGRRPDWFYRRYGSPNGRALEEVVRDLEGGEDALAASSGMSACVSIFWALARRGDHVVAQRDLYGGTTAFFTQALPTLGVEVSFAESSPRAIAAAIRPNTRFLFVETISNPLTRVCDLPAVARLARAAGAKTVVDSTFATPLLSRPIEFGIDLVYHSATKFLNGHGDAVAGVVVGRSADIGTIRKHAISVGATISPLDAWLVHRGIRTLDVRIDRICRNALEIARFLERNRKISRVHYPGLPSHPDRRLAAKLLPRGAGGILSFELKGGDRAAKLFVRSTRLVKLVPSLGGTSTTLTHPWSSSHSYLPEAERLRLGVGPGLLRASAGIDDPRDVIEDLESALRKI